MPVLDLRLDTGGSEVDFGRLRLSQGIGYSVGHAARVLFADASGLPNVVSRLTTGFGSHHRRRCNLFTEIVTLTRQRPITGKL
jgi:hypothetical protein